MAGIVTNNFRLHNAEQFFEQFSEASPSVLYVMVARSNPWPDDDNPPAPADSVRATEYDAWRNILGMKKVAVSDVSYAATRLDWTSGDVYDEYSDIHTNLDEQQFYVLTEDYNVYKCLFNNGGIASTVKPTGTGTANIETSDGYIWKFLYSVTAGDALKFLTSGFIPVKHLSANNGSTQWDVQQAAANGSIEVVGVTGAGSSYLTHTAAAQAGGATSIQLATSASGLGGSYVNSAVYIASGTGAGQIRRITGYNGTSKTATVTPAWGTNPDATSTYRVSPRVWVTGDGASWDGYSVVSGGGISKIVTIDPGENYSRANVHIQANTGSGGTAAARLSPFGGHGADPVKDLFAYNVMLNVRLSGSESNTITVQNEFRVLAIVTDPKFANGTAATGSGYNMTTRLNLTGASGSFIEDESIRGNTSKANGVIVEANSSVLRLTALNGAFMGSEIVTGLSSGATATLASQVKPVIAKHSGRIIYLENRPPVSRDASQVEDLKILIRF